MDAFNHMKILGSIGYQVSFIPADSLLFREKYTTDLQRIGVECLYSPYVQSVDEYIIQNGKDYNVVFLCRAFNASKYIDTVRKYCPRAKVVFSTVDLNYLREMRRAKIEKSVNLIVAAQQVRKIELDVMKKANCTLVVSEKELEMLRAELPDVNIVHLPLITSIGNREEVPFTERKDIFFVGGYLHLPNIDAVRYFFTEIWPLIQPRVPGVKFYIIGANPPEEIQNLAGPDVIVLGHVDDLSGFFNGCRLSVAPIRYGAGIKGKVLHSLGYGLPVVASSIAIEGTGLIDNEQILVADAPQAFADDVVRLYNDEELWRKLSQNGLEFFKENYSFEVGRQNFIELMKSLNRRVSGTVGKSLALTEISSFTQYEIHEKSMAAEYIRRSGLESQLIGQKEGFTTPGYCYVCGENVAFRTNFTHALKDNAGNLIPNWREHMVCPKCNLNNRMRAAIQIFEQYCEPQLDDEIYLTEQTTPLYHWFRQNYSAVIGSEYLGNDIPYGSLDETGIRNETLKGLTFHDDEFTYVLSFDVFEHIPDYASAFRETLRCLKPDFHCVIQPHLGQ
jgi:glycosyltransferase involved in cell wall biosynthesis